MKPDDQPSDIKAVTEELYKKNLDLVNANRALTILQKLYQITESTLDVTELCQNFIITIVDDLKLLSGTVVIKDAKTNSLKAVAITNSKINNAALTLIGSKLTDLSVSLSEVDNIVVKSFNNRKKEVAPSLYDVLRPLVTEDKAKAIEKIRNVKSTIVYPIQFGNESLGAFLVSIDRSAEDLSDFENTMLERIATVFGVAIDRLMLYLDLQYANKRLKELDAQKDEFISMAAHELRAPMTAIKGYISMVIEGDTGDIPEKARGYLADANAINDRLVRLVNNMLNVSRIEEGRMVYQEEVDNLSQVARAVYAQFRPEAERKGLEFKLDVPPEIKDKVRVDPDRIHEVVGNLVSNAVKYTDVGSVIVKLSQSNEGNSVRMEVIDTGMGISPEEQAKLFRKFARAESAVGKTTGTGLGLYISKLLVEKFGGKIGIQSEAGKGSIFWFELPLVS